MKNVQRAGYLRAHFWIAPILLLIFLFPTGCAKTSDETSQGSLEELIPATAEVERALGVSNWFVIIPNSYSIRVAGLNRQGDLVGEMRMTAQRVEEDQVIIYDLHIEQFTRLVVVEGVITENTIFNEPKGMDWIQAIATMSNSLSLKSSFGEKNTSANLVDCVNNLANDCVGLMCSIANQDMLGCVVDGYKLYCTLRDCNKAINTSSSSNGTMVAMAGTAQGMDWQNEGGGSGWQNDGNNENSEDQSPNNGTGNSDQDTSYTGGETDNGDYGGSEDTGGASFDDPYNDQYDDPDNNGDDPGDDGI